MDTNILKNSIKGLDKWFESPEMAFIALNGGFELTIRDRLLFSIQKRMPDSCIKSEHYYDKKWADIAVINDGKLTSLIEMKTNFIFQLDEITGYGTKDWEDCDFTWPKKQNSKIGRIEKDQQKWSERSSNISLFGIHIVTRIDSLSQVLMDHCCKYPKIYKNNSKDINKAIDAYFKNLAYSNSKNKKESLKTHKTQASCKFPHAVTASLTFYILEL